MMICWYCHWGWPKPVREIYDRAESEIDAILDDLWLAGEGDGLSPEYLSAIRTAECGEHALKFGPAHVVWEDENWGCARSCMKDCGAPGFSDWPPAILDVVRRSLRELMALPAEVRNVEPKDYDGEHPENFPPPAGMEMVRR